jgi:hypothetical protein
MSRLVRIVNRHQGIFQDLVNREDAKTRRIQRNKDDADGADSNQQHLRNLGTGRLWLSRRNTGLWPVPVIRQSSNDLIFNVLCTGQKLLCPNPCVGGDPALKIVDAIRTHALGPGGQ